MDPFSQAALGAVAAQASAQHKLGFRVVVAGAVAGAAPDLDIIFASDYYHNLQVHRGVTHSLFFAPLVGPALGYLIHKYECHRSGDAFSLSRMKYWMLAMFLALLSHPLLDVFTPYGTQLLAPFSDQRFAFFVMPIIDPLYTVPLFVGVYLAWRYQKKINIHLAGIGFFLLSSSYIGYSWYLGDSAKQEAIRQLDLQGVSYNEVESFPTFMQVHYRRVVARTATDDRVGYISMWRPCTINWGVAQQSPLSAFDPVKDLREVRIFEWFTMGWVHRTALKQGNTKSYHYADLRYGFARNPKESFFSVNVIETEDGFEVNNRNPIGNSGDIGGRFEFLLQTAYPRSCDESSLASL